METFNIKRFGNVCARLAMIRKREYFNIFLGIMLLFAFMSVLTCNPFNLDALSAEQYRLGFFRMGGFFAVVSVIYIVLAGSTVIKDLKTKQQKIDELMLPATNLEKFTARVIGATLLPVVILAAAYFAADLLQMLINMLLHKGTFASITVGAVHMIEEASRVAATPFEQQTAISMLIMAFFSLLASNAAYILGGMLFRKTAWLKTSLSLVVLGIVIFSLFIGYTYLVYQYTDYVVYIPEGINSNWVGIVASLIQVSVCYYFAYRIYCRLQAVNTRWLNI